MTHSHADERAYEEVISEHLDALFRTALRFCGGCHDEAEDLLQDTLLQGLRHWHELRERANARAWLFQILSRTHLNRRRSRDRRHEVNLDADSVNLEQALAAWRPASEPEQLLRHETGLDRIVAAVDQMPAAWREVFWLSDVEGFSYRELAQLLDIPEGSVASRLYRARHQLQALLQVDEYWLKWR